MVSHQSIIKVSEMRSDGGVGGGRGRYRCLLDLQRWIRATGRVIVRINQTHIKGKRLVGGADWVFGELQSHIKIDDKIDDISAQYRQRILITHPPHRNNEAPFLLQIQAFLSLIHSDTTFVRFNAERQTEVSVIIRMR